jgi:hypothetical protein
LPCCLLTFASYGIYLAATGTGAPLGGLWSVSIFPDNSTNPNQPANTLMASSTATKNQLGYIACDFVAASTTGGLQMVNQDFLLLNNQPTVTGPARVWLAFSTDRSIVVGANSNGGALPCLFFLLADSCQRPLLGTNWALLAILVCPGSASQRVAVAILRR